MGPDRDDHFAKLIEIIFYSPLCPGLHDGAFSFLAPFLSLFMKIVSPKHKNQNYPDKQKDQ
jgi:hypothetical protein